MLESLSLAAGLSWGSGLRLYLTVLLAGVFERLGFVHLPDTLSALSSPWVIGVAAVLTITEFLADKIPAFDSLWDAVHTFIRIPAGAVLAAGALGHADPALLTVAALAGGTLAGTAHLAKAGTRALINLSPEPVSNVVTSTAEDGLVFGGVLLALFVPLLFLVLMIGFLLLAAWALPRLWRGVQGGFAAWRRIWCASGEEQARLSDSVRHPAAPGAPIPPKRRLSSIELLRQSIRMTARDWRAGELTMLLLALVLAVAALSSVGFLANRLHLGLERDARQMIAADFIVRADHPIDPQFVQQAKTLGLNTASTAIFPSMVNSAGAQPASRLAAVKAVSAGYPLRGELRIASAPGAPDHPTRAIPPPGTVWVDQALLDALKLRVGDAVKVGSRGFRIDAVITRELDRGFSFVNFSPRVMLRDDDVPSTGLITYGSRVTYRLLVAGTDASVAQFAQFAHDKVDGGKMRGVALESLQDGQPQVRQTLDRAGHFLTLVSLLTALLAAVAIAMAAHRYMRRHLDGCAAMRCLGVSQTTLRALFTLEFLGLGLIGGAVGVVLGYAGHMALLLWLGSLIDVALPYPSAWPALEGIAAGLVLLLGFALPPLLPLTRVPPVRVLRREWGEAGRTAWAAYALGIVLFAALLIVAAGELKLGGIVAGGFAGGLLVFACIARLALWGASRVVRSERVNAGIGWRYALASLERRSSASALQITALGIGLMCLLLIAMTRNDLVAGWRKSTPPDAPNEFIIDIQPDQRDVVTQYLSAHGLSNTVLSPMVRGRLIAINGKPVNPDNYKTDDAKRLVDREFNLSYTTTLPEDNRIAAGRWYGDTGKPEISIEQGLAKLINVKPGDTLRFDVTGMQIDAPVTSLRKLDWGSFKVNFFVLMPPAALQDFPATFITSFHLAPEQRATIDGLISAYPNLTAIDTGPILAQVQRVLEQVIGAVQFLFAFTLVAGVLVLYAALAGTRDERMRESALLRALGASHRQVRAVQVAEFVAVGALAGLMAAVGAQLIGWVLATRVFEFYLSFDPWLLPAGIAAGIVCAGVGGWLSLRHVLARPALQSLRDA